jgi:hypothetical protein
VEDSHGGWQSGSENDDSPADMRPAIAGRPVYLAMAMDSDNKLKLKPQNLLLNLPLNRA